MLTLATIGSKMTEEEVKQALDAISKKENGSKVLEILNVISYFAPENIHTKIFLSISGHEEELGASINLLKQYSMVYSDREGAVLSVTRSLQKIIRKKLQKQKKEEEILKKALQLLFENRINSNNVDHYISVWSYMSGYQEIIKKSSGLLPSLIVIELRKSDRYKEACIFGRKALDLLEIMYGESHLATLTLQRNIGMLLGLDGKYEEALEILWPLYGKAVELLDREARLDILILIAKQLCELSRCDEALQIYHSLLIGQQISKTRDITILTVWHDYSILLIQLGNYRKALEILKEILKRSQILCVDDEDTVTVKSSIALVFIRQSKYCEALELFREILHKRTAVLGENHIDTLRTRNFIALVFLNQRRYDEALEIYEVVANQFEQILGKEHPDTLTTRANLASAFHHVGECQKALAIFKDVNKKQKETLGPEHARTLTVKRNIVAVLFEQGKYDEALRMFEEFLQGFCKVFGPAHPDTAEIMITLGLLRFMQTSDSIHSIARQGNLSKMKSLAQNGADINKKDDNGNTPLHYAAQYGHISVIRLLLESGAIYNTKNKESKIPLQLAKNRIVKNLFKSVAKLFTDVKAGNHKQVAELIKEKTIVNAKEDGGSTSLHWAAYKGHSSIVKLLLESGADATQVTDKGNTPLHTASSQGYEDIVDVLLQHASRNKLNDFIDAKTTVSGATSLHIAVKDGSLDVTKSLLKRGAKYDIKNNEGKTPLDLSKDQNVNDLLKLVEELFTDAKSGNVEIISKLGAVKPDEFVAVTNARNNAGKTFLQLAITVANRHQNTVSKLSEMLGNSD